MTIAKKHNVVPSSNALNYRPNAQRSAAVSRPKLGCKTVADNFCAIDAARPLGLFASRSEGEYEPQTGCTQIRQRVSRRLA